MTDIELQTPKEALKYYFGFDTFKGHQENIITATLNGEDSFVIMPTGAGKSLCYQLPALMMEGTAIIISPLIALMKNQVDQIRGFNESDTVAHFLNSSLSKADIQKVKDDTRSEKTKMLYIAPETLKKEETIDFLKEIKVSFIAVDEAHCISEWGHDFRPEYRRIKLITKELGNVPMMALTATATPKVQSDIQKNLQMTEATLFKSSFNRHNLYYEIRPKGKKDANVKNIVSYIKSKPNRSGIIYCLSRKRVEEISEILNVNGIKSIPYHAGLDAKTRASHQDKFLMEDVKVVVATIAFGMGIDKPDVRFVMHYDVPKSLEGYYQETGRAGRDGIESDCVLYYNPADIEKLESFMKDKPVAEREIGSLLTFETQSFVESSGCRRKMLLHYFGESFNDENCNNMCDNCRHPKPKEEVTNETKMFLEAVRDLGEKFDVDHLAQIFMGERTQAITLNRHDKLPVFASGAYRDMAFWKSIGRLCMLNLYTFKDIENYGLVKMNAKGAAWLAAPQKEMMAKDQSFERVTDEDGSSFEVEAVYDDQLFTILKDLVKTVAKEKKLPPYVIFTDPSLEDMAVKYPITMEELQNIQGVNSNKAAKYGQKFIEAISNYVEENEIERPDDMVVKSVVNKSGAKVALILNIDKKNSIDDIARGRGMNRDEMVAEIEGIIYTGTKLNLRYAAQSILDQNQQDEIFEYYRQSSSDDLEEAVKYFDRDYNHEEMRLMRMIFISEVAN
ncbi:MAG: DNA helicase RecQ [Bacteroidota bacterium]|nr:DNA helicase RecQ [Bacteroidota bacterium]